MTPQTLTRPPTARHGGTPMAIDDKFLGLLAQIHTYKSSPQGRQAAGVPTSATTLLPDGSTFPVGKKVNELRRSYRRGQLAQDRISALEGIPGWTWNQRNTSDANTRWNTKLAQLTHYYEANDTLDGLRKADPTLSRWLYAQQRADLTPDQREALAEVPGAVLDIGSPDLRGVNGLIAGVRAWSKENPEVDIAWIPKSAEVMVDGELLAIGRRVFYYRDCYAEGSLSTKEIARIQKALPGWSWTSERPQAVDLLVAATTTYLTQHPQLDASTVPHDAEMILPPTGETYLIGRQLLQYRRADGQAATSGLTREEQRKLRSLPGWTPLVGNKHRWNLDPFLTMVDKYLRDHPEITDPNKIPHSATVPRNNGTNYNLGRAVRRYRNKLAKHELAPKNIRALTERGFHV